MIEKLWKRKWWVLLGVVFVGGCSYAVMEGGSTDPQYDFAEAAYVDIVQEVSVTGTVEADPKINLRFQRTGQVQDILVDVGNFVKKGETLAYLDSTSLSIEVMSAEANLALARANYNQLLAGSTDEAVSVAEASVAKATADLEQAEQSLIDTTALAEESIEAAELDYETASTNYENAVDTYGEDVVHAYEDLHNEIDDALSEVEDSLRDVDTILGVDTKTANDDIEDVLIASSKSDFEQAQDDYETVSNSLDSLAESFSEMTDSDYDELDAFVDEINALLDDIADLLDDVDSILAKAPATGNYTETVKDTKRATIASEISDINTASTSFSNAEQAVESAYTSEGTSLRTYESALAEAEQALSQAQVQAESNINSAEVSVEVYAALLAQAEATLAEVEAGPRDVDLASALASIDSAEAAYDLALHNLSLAYLTAPADGVITELYFDDGENVTTAEDFLVMISDQYQIIANVSETDIAKVEVGDKVNLTLDAFSYDKILEAEITEIDPAETVVQGVIYYQITAVFAAEDTDIKPGMTANMDIVTAEVMDVLSVPIRAVKYDGPRTYVLQMDPLTGETLETDVEAGVRGDQYVEILSGLEEGDEVITYMR